MFFTSSLLLFFTCTWQLSDCTAEDVYALVTKEAKLYFDYNQTWNEAFIENGADLVVLIRKTSTNLKIWFFAGRSIIVVKYIDKTNQGMVTIRNVSSSYNGNIIMYDSTSGRLLKRWHVHVLERPPANPIIQESSPPWAGEDYQLNCIGDSFGVTKYKWYKEGQLLSPDTKYNVTGNKLTIRNIQPEDSTKLTCVLFITDDIQSNNSVIFTVDVLYCTAEDVYALVTKEAKLYFDYKLPWNIANIDKGGVFLASIEKISVNEKLKIAGKDGIGVKYIDKTNQGMVTIGNVSSSYTGNITMYDPTSRRLLKRWHVHVLDAIGVPIYVVIPMAIVTLVVVAYAIWIHQKRLTTLETDRPHSLEVCDHELYITPIGGDIHLPIPLMNDGHASDSKTTQLDSCMLILHTNQNPCMDGYEMVDVSSIDADERVCNSNETDYEPFETISKAVDDNCGYLTVLGVLETSV